MTDPRREAQQIIPAMKDAWSIYEPLMTVIARWDCYGPAVHERVRALVATAQMTRLEEATVGQFLAGLDQIQKEQG